MAKQLRIIFLFFKEINVASATLAGLLAVSTTIFGCLYGWAWLKLRRMGAAAQQARGHLNALKGHIGKNGRGKAIKNIF